MFHLSQMLEVRAETITRVDCVPVPQVPKPIVFLWPCETLSAGHTSCGILHMHTTFLQINVVLCMFALIKHVNKQHILQISPLRAKRSDCGFPQLFKPEIQISSFNGKYQQSKWVTRRGSLAAYQNVWNSDFECLTGLLSYQPGVCRTLRALRAAGELSGAALHPGDRIVAWLLPVSSLFHAKCMDGFVYCSETTSHRKCCCFIPNIQRKTWCLTNKVVVEFEGCAVHLDHNMSVSENVLQVSVTCLIGSNRMSVMLLVTDTDFDSTHL